MFSFSSNHRSIGGMEASISMAVMLVVRNAPMIMCRHLFCIELSWLSTLPFFDFQNAASPYVATGSIAPMYSNCACVWCIPLIELLSSLRACMAVIALDVVFCMCVVKLRWESSHTPRYFIVFAGLTVFSSLGMFVGINTEGPSSECLLQLYLVKWINSFLTWSALSPHVVSQSWAAWNASSVIFVLVL